MYIASKERYTTMEYNRCGDKRTYAVVSRDS